MATFQAQVEGITGLTISSSDTNPTQAQLTEFLKDGVIDVTNRIVRIIPQDRDHYTRKTASDSQGVEFGRADIISVVREANVDGSSDGSSSWRNCRKVPISLQSRVVDTDSLHYASIYNPVYTLDDTGVVNVYPTPSSNNGIEVYYINNTPVNGSGVSLAYSHDDIKYFPSSKIYLVVLYASIKSLEQKLADYAHDEEDVELVGGMNAAIASLKQQYEMAFQLMIPPQARQQAQPQRARA